MDEIELEKETYEKVVSLIQSGETAKALEAILADANEDSSLASTILGAIEGGLSQKADSSPAKGERPNPEEKKKPKKKKPKKKGKSSSPEPDNSPTISIPLPPKPSPLRKRKAALLGDHQGIAEIELEKETFLQVADLIKAEKRELALDLIFEEANENESLAKQLLDLIEGSLPENPVAEETASPAADIESSVVEREKPKEETQRVPIAKSPIEKPSSPKEEPDPIEQAIREIRRKSLIVLLFGGLLGYLFFRSGMRPLKAILTNLVICLIAGLSIGYFVYADRSDGRTRGSDSVDQETLNFVAVALCPLLAEDLDLHSGQRIFCNQKRSRFAYHLYEESRKIDGSESIKGPFSEETLEAGLYVRGKQIRGQLNRGQRTQFLKMYESGQWPPVGIVVENGRFRLEYPTYGNVPGVMSLSVARRE